MISVKRILDFIFDDVGSEPSDAVLAECADTCETVKICLLSSIRNESVRETALGKLEEDSADCVRRINDAMDAAERGVINLEYKRQ